LFLPFDPAFLQQFFQKSRARRQRTRFDPACPPQVLHELALGVTSKRHFFDFSSTASRASRSAFRRSRLFLEFRIGLAVRYRLPRRNRIESPSIGLIRNLLLRTVSV
jgi:hypothetical protein